MRGIPLRRQALSPILVGREHIGHVVQVLAFGMDHLAETARVIDLPHGVTVFMESGRFEHHVLLAGCLHGFAQHVRRAQRAPRRPAPPWPRACRVEDLDAVSRMAGSVRGHEDGLDRVVLYKFFQRRVGLFTAAEPSPSRHGDRENKSLARPPRSRSDGPGSRTKARTCMPRCRRSPRGSSDRLRAARLPAFLRQHRRAGTAGIVAEARGRRGNAERIRGKKSERSQADVLQK